MKNHIDERVRALYCFTSTVVSSIAAVAVGLHDCDSTSIGMIMSITKGITPMDINTYIFDLLDFSANDKLMLSFGKSKFVIKSIQLYCLRKDIQCT